MSEWQTTEEQITDAIDEMRYDLVTVAAQQYLDNAATKDRRAADDVLMYECDLLRNVFAWGTTPVEQQVHHRIWQYMADDLFGWDTLVMPAPTGPAKETP